MTEVARSGFNWHELMTTDLEAARRFYREVSGLAVVDGPASPAGPYLLLMDGDRPVAADLVDFKTDRVSPDRPEAIDARVAHYRPQLEAYRRAVARLLRLDAAQVSARLAFVEAGVVRAV